MIASGSCSSKVTWRIEDDYTMFFSGNGGISFSTTTSMAPPWYAYIDNINTLILEEGITTIQQNSFSACSGITSVTLPSTLYAIANSVFPNSVEKLYISDLQSWLRIYNNATNNATYIDSPMKVSKNGCDLYINGELASHIVIPDETTSIRKDCFHGCKSIQTIDFPDSLKTIETSAFENCISLRKLSVPNNVTTLKNAFIRGCSNLEELIIGNGVTSIPSYMFIGLSHLKKLVIGSGVKYIELGGLLGFDDCVSLTEINISADNSTYAAVDGIIYTKDISTVVLVPPNYIHNSLPNTVTAVGNYAYYGLSMTSFVIPDTVIDIGTGSFRRCDKLTRITIPHNVLNIGPSAFNECVSLLEVVVKPIAPPTCTKNDSGSIVSVGSFANCSSLTAIKVPIGTGEAYKAATGWSSYAHLIIESEEAGYDDPPTDPDPEPDLPVEPDVPTFDRTSMILGWLVGRRMRSLRSSGSQNGS